MEVVSRFLDNLFSKIGAVIRHSQQDALYSQIIIKIVFHKFNSIIELRQSF